jgi:hypothetical protein
MKQAERDAAESRAWEVFEPKLNAVNNFPDAEILVLNAPGPGSPGQKYYSNLGSFVRFFLNPIGTSREMRKYIELIEKFEKNGELTPGVAKNAIASLEKAIAEKLLILKFNSPTKAASLDAQSTVGKPAIDRL